MRQIQRAVDRKKRYVSDHFDLVSSSCDLDNQHSAMNQKGRDSYQSSQEAESSSSLAECCEDRATAD